MSGADTYRIVEAARAGNRQAQDDLVAIYLPLVYNIVGRALGGHADVDDVVQDTMLRAMDGLSGLRDPASFRSWLVAIAMNQIRGHWQEHQTYQAHQDFAAHGSYASNSWHEQGGGPELFDIADPRMDFVELTIVRLGLSGQRREVAEATRWLDDDDRELLALWWLEAAGEITRPELADALGLTQQHAAVRIQRMKGQLELSRVVVRALLAAPRCPELHAHTAGWDGAPSPLWRKRFARHIRECRDCSGFGGDLVPAERLLVALGLVPPAAGLASLVAATRHAAATHLAATHLSTGTGSWAQAAHAARAGAETWTQSAPAGPGSWSPSGPGASPYGSTPPGSGMPPRPRAGGHAHRSPRPARGLRRLTAHPLLSSAAVGITAIAAVTGIVYGTADSAHGKSRVTDSLEVSRPGPTSATPSTAPTPTPDATEHPTSATPTAHPTTSRPKPTPTTPSSAAPPPANNAPAVQQVLDLINKARADQGLAPLTITDGLTTSATKHTQTMSSGCGLSHQCSGEPGLGARETAAGVHWMAAGENIGDGGPVGTSNQSIASMALALTQDMLNEKPPNDGHRRNILSSTFTHIGITVVRDSKGTVWMTQDFSD